MMSRRCFILQKQTLLLGFLCHSWKRSNSQDKLYNVILWIKNIESGPNDSISFLGGSVYQREAVLLVPSTVNKPQHSIHKPSKWSNEHNDQVLQPPRWAVKPLGQTVTPRVCRCAVNQSSWMVSSYWCSSFFSPWYWPSFWENAFIMTQWVVMIWRLGRQRKTGRLSGALASTLSLASSQMKKSFSNVLFSTFLIKDTQAASYSQLNVTI